MSLAAAIGLLLAAVAVAVFVEDRGVRAGIALPASAALAVAAGFAVNRWRHGQGRLEAVRQEGETKFRALAENIPLVTWLATPGNGASLLYVSPQLQTLLGYEPAEWQAKPDLFTKLLHSDDRERVLVERDAARAEGVSFASTYRLVARDGRIVGIRDTTTTVRDDSGEPLYTQTILADDAERRRADEDRDRLRGAEREAASRNVVLQWRLDLLHDVSELLASSVDAHTSVPQVSRILVRELADWCTVDAVEEDGDVVRFAAAAGFREASPAPEPGPAARKVIQSGKKLFVAACRA